MILKNKRVATNICNIVTANQCANIVLAIGASPVMSTSLADINDLLKISHSLTINIGTANENQIGLIIKAVKKAKVLEIPIILDPVGSGASEFRTNLARKIVKIGVSIIRGNASEILSLLFSNKTKGVDNQSFNNKTNTFKEISKKFKTILLVTDEKDLIVNYDDVIIIRGGNKNMMLKTGMGCLLSALVGALATELSLLDAAILGSKIMKKVGEKLFNNSLPSYSEIYNFVFNYE